VFKIAVHDMPNVTLQQITKIEGPNRLAAPNQY